MCVLGEGGGSGDRRVILTSNHQVRLMGPCYYSYAEMV